MKAIDLTDTCLHWLYLMLLHTHFCSYCLNEAININLELLCLEIMLQSEWKGHFVKTSIHIVLTFCNTIAGEVFTVSNII